VSGHYVAAVRVAGGDWWECDDQDCARVSAQAVCEGRLPALQRSERVPGCSQTAYVLVYHARHRA
jgi:hypothetical protein